MRHEKTKLQQRTTYSTTVQYDTVHVLLYSSTGNTDYKMSELRKNTKTLYFLRQKSLEVDKVNGKVRLQ